MIHENYLDFRCYQKLSNYDKQLILDMARGHYNEHSEYVRPREFTTWCENIQEIKSVFNLYSETEKVARQRAQETFNDAMDALNEQIEILQQEGYTNSEIQRHLQETYNGNS